MESSARMFGKAAMIPVLLAPTASIARQDGHRTDANPIRCFNIAASSASIERVNHAYCRPSTFLPFFGLATYSKSLGL
jgi:hypothetical protein